MKKAEVVFIPFPFVSHLVSTLEFAKHLINRDNRLRVTVLILKFPYTTETDAYIKSIPISDSLQVINLPECSLPPTNDLNTTPINAFVEVQKPNVKQAVSNLITGQENSVFTAFVVDMFCTTMIDIAKEFSIPTLVFFTAGIASLGLNLHLHTLYERDNVDSIQLMQQTELAVPCFTNPVPTNTFPTTVLRKERKPFFTNYVGGHKNANAIVVNSFEELEPYAVHSFSSHPDMAGLPIIYPVGPMLNSETKTNETNDIIKWLDDQPLSSVVFLCFGSMGTFNKDQVKEIARAIEDSGVRFVWSIRKPPPKDTWVGTSDYSRSDLDLLLPDGFLDRTVEIGKVIGWAPQTPILSHPATGGFVSHCGWNSILESIYYGVPIATWPMFGEQQTNAFELVCELKIAVEIALDYRYEYNIEPNYLVTADKIERGIRSVMENGEVRRKVKEMSRKSRKTLLEGGSSYTYLDRLIDYIINKNDT